MTFKEALEIVKARWFEILTVLFGLGVLWLVYVYGARHQNAVINASAGACESVGLKVGLERKQELIGTTWKIICIEKGELQPEPVVIAPEVKP